MTIRRINHTGRQRLEKGHVRIVIRDGEPPSFVAQVDLTAYELPTDALVYLEAYRQATTQRFPMGSTFSLTKPLSGSLAGFGSASGVRFRLRVVQAQPDPGQPALVLAACDGVRPKGDDGRERAESLLPVEAGSFSDRPWRLEIEDGQAVLFVSRALVDDISAFVQSRAFRALVLPDVFRQILDQFVRREGITEIDEEEPDKSEWLRFVVEHLGLAVPGSDEDLAEWIDQAVTRWCQLSAVPEEFRGWWTEGATT